MKENLQGNIQIGYVAFVKIEMHTTIDGFDQISSWQNLYPEHHNKISTIISIS